MDTKDCNIINKEKKFTAKRVVSLVFVIIFALITLCFPIMYAFGISAGKNYENKVLKEMPKIKVRNPVALSPLLQKGGIHETEKPRAQHRRDRQQTKQQLSKGVW